MECFVTSFEDACPYDYSRPGLSTYMPHFLFWSTPAPFSHVIAANRAPDRWRRIRLLVKDIRGIRAWNTTRFNFPGLRGLQ